MKKTLLVSAISLGLISAAHAGANFSFSFGFALPGAVISQPVPPYQYYPAPVYAPRPPVWTPPAVAVAPAPYYGYYGYGYRYGWRPGWYGYPRGWSGYHGGWYRH